MTFHLRPAELKDAAFLTQLSIDTFMESFGHLYRDKDSEAYVSAVYNQRIQAEEIADADTFYFIAEADGVPVGFVKFGAYKLPLEVPERPVMELHRLYVLQSHQGQGIGRALMENAIEHFRQAKVKAALLGVWEKNVRAQAFYARYGFTPVGEYVFYVGNQADRELIFKKAF